MLCCFCIILPIPCCTLLGRKGGVPRLGPDPETLIAIFRGTSRPGSCGFLYSCFIACAFKRSVSLGLLKSDHLLFMAEQNCSRYTTAALSQDHAER